MGYDTGREHREAHWSETLITTASLGVTAGVLFLLAPGIIYDWAYDWFAHTPEGFLMGAVKDGVTWIVAFVFWVGVIIVIATLRSIFARSPAPPVADEVSEPTIFLTTDIGGNRRPTMRLRMRTSKTLRRPKTMGSRAYVLRRLVPTRWDFPAI